MTKTHLILPLIPLLALACSKPAADEQQGADMLRQARTLYAQGHYAPARDTILSLRRRFPKALQARRQAILLMDSLELQLAQGDTLKQEFYRRKLQHDTQAHDQAQTTRRPASPAR